MSAVPATFASLARGARTVIPAQRAITVLLIVMVAINALYLAGLLASGGETTTPINVWLPLAAQWVPVTALWLIALATYPMRVEVTLATVAVTLSALGDSYFTLATDADGYLPFPSPADIGYLLFYPIMIAALLVLVLRHRKSTTAIVLIEGAVATLGAAALLAMLVDPIITGAFDSESMIGNVVALSYPLFDIVLLALLAGILASSSVRRTGRRWWSLAVGLGITAAADIAFALFEADGAFLSGSPLDAAWPIGLAFITWWVAGVGVEGPAPARRRRPLALPLPAIAVFTGLTVLIVATQVRLSTLAIVLGALTVGLAAVPIIFRQTMLGRLLTAQRDLVRQLTEFDRTKSETMVTINHEFGKPVAAINASVARLLDGEAGELPADAVAMLRTIEDGGAQLDGLMDELLTVSKLEAHTASVTLTPVYISGIVARAGASARKLARAKGVELSVECDNFAIVVDADAAQLERAIGNLIDNAVTYSSGGGRVTVTAELVGGDAVVRVIDRGRGIPEEDLPHLFDNFFRASNVPEEVPGVGLGLPIVRRVIEAHKGRIVAQSTLGVGTIMTVRLPLSAHGMPIPAYPGLAR